jgi:hypothetical protein
VDKAGKRIQVLLDWRDRTEAAGHPVPSVPDMMRIGAAGELRPDGVLLDAVEPWAETIAFLLKQLKFGVSDPVAQLPDDLITPAPPNGSAPDSFSPVQDPVLAALLRWWKKERAADPRLKVLKEHHLRNIAMTGSATEAEIRRHLPASLTVFARDIAGVVAGVAPAAEPSRPAEAAPAPDGPTKPGPTKPGPTKPGPPKPGPTPSTVKAGPAAPPRPSPVRAVADAAPAELSELAVLDLADYAYTPAEHPPVEIRRRFGPDGIVMTWPPPDPSDAVVLYRVVSADGTYAPSDPQTADVLVVTSAPRCVDARPFRAPVRHVQVWQHSGPTREAAAAAEPALHAEVMLISQVTDAYVGEDGRSIVGQWKVPPGVRSVEVLRVPVEQARRDGHSSSDFRLTPMRPFVNGFVDDGAERGHDYVYELSIEVELEGSRLRSDPVKVEVSVSAVLAPLRDLRRVDRPDDPSVFDLHWTAEGGGEVRIYRTPVAPEAGVEQQPVPESALARAKLDERYLVRRPIEPGPGGEWAMLGVSWPDGWTSAYLTPVTVLNGTAAVGPSLLVLRLQPIRHARIVERTHSQVLTFAWPDGADTVLAFVGGPGQDAVGAQRGEPVEITRDQYTRYGGMYFQRPLAPKGCSVHLVPVAYNEGRRQHGAAVSLAYPGLTRLRYQVRIERDRAQMPSALTLRILSEFDHPGFVYFVLVLNGDRLPLHEKDGIPLPVKPFGDPGATGGTPQFRPSSLPRDPGQAVWTAQLDGRVGYVRLFVCVAPDRPSLVALLDPDVRQLMAFPQRAGA